MSDRSNLWTVVLGLAGAGLLLSPSPAFAQARHDLDNYSHDELVRDLEAEFRPMLFDGTREADDEEVSIDDMRASIAYAFSLDADEAEDSPEGAVDEADLEAEMEEDGTTLQDVIDEALEEADELSVRTPSPAWTIVRVRWSAGSPPARPAPDGKVKRKVAYTSLINRLVCHTNRSCGS